MPAWVVVWIVGVGGIMGEREAAVAWWRAVSGRGSLGSGGGPLLYWLGERFRLEWPGERSRVEVSPSTGAISAMWVGMFKD